MEAARRKERWNWFWEGLRHLVPQSPVWRTATTTLVVVMVITSVLWRMGIFAPSVVSEGIVSDEPAARTEEFGMGGGTSEMTSPPQALLELGVVPSETIIFTSGEVAEIELAFENVGSESICHFVFPFPLRAQVKWEYPS